MPTVDESVSQAIDVFHLPSGVDVSDYEIYEVATSDGVKRLRYPRLDGPKVTSLAKQLAEEHDQYLRLAAEYDNYRKRTAKEKEGIYANAKIDTIKGMLPVYDNLERGLAQFGAEDDDPHKKGLEMIFNQYKEALTKLGVTPIDCVGKEFDPERHNAVMHIEDESCGENTVVEVLQQGFMLGDKVLRFAIVKVAN